MYILSAFICLYITFSVSIDLVEHLRALGFTRLVSLENFSVPNFPLVAEILTWSIKMIDSNFDIVGSIECEQDRVILIRTAAVFFVSWLL